jgi:hypothetical protein
MVPHRGTCRGCGHPVIRAQSEDEGLLVLDVHESTGGRDRWAIWDDGTVHPVLRHDTLGHFQHACGEAAAGR